MIKLLHKLKIRFLDSVSQKLYQHQNMMNVLSENIFRTRAIIKKKLNQPITVLFVCHEPALWNMFKSIYYAMDTDLNFSPLVVALPYKHDTLPAEQYKDSGIFEFCESKGIKVIKGYNTEDDDWLNPASLNPDYVFYQTPYNIFHQTWSVSQLSMIARVCYVPYGSSVARGDIASMVHPVNFFRHVYFSFVENQAKYKLLINRFEDNSWFNKKRVVVTGYPKYDYLSEGKTYTGNSWKQGLSDTTKRILWTPRFTTAEGTCHFFEYKNFFFDFCKNNGDIDFLFRPHPLCFQNFLNTGEMTLEDQNNLRQRYKMSKNMAIDESFNYEDTFITSDILISDYSSLLIEYFITGKPIIYTHRKNEFNDYALALSKGMYWVRNIEELQETIMMLIKGDDPLLNKRKELIKLLFFKSADSAGLTIKNLLRLDYSSIC